MGAVNCVLCVECDVWGERTRVCGGEGGQLPYLYGKKKGCVCVRACVYVCHHGSIIPYVFMVNKFS